MENGKKVVFMMILVIAVLGLTGILSTAEDKVVLEPIIVTATGQNKAAMPPDIINIEAPGKATVSSIPDLLSNTSGIDVQRRSILTPKQNEVRLRGLDEQRYQVLLNGRPLNGTGVMGGYYVDWSQLSFSDFDQIHVSKGGFDAKYGNTLGGTIELISERPSQKPQVRFNAGIERFGTYHLGAAFRGGHGPLALSLTADQNKTDGYLRNSRVDRQSFSGRVTFSFAGDGQISLGARYGQGDYNMPVENKKGNPGYRSDYPESKGIFLTGPWPPFPWGDKHGDDTYYTKERYEFDLGFKKNILGVNTDIKVYFNDEDRTEKITSYNTGETVLKRELSPDCSWGWLIRTSMGKGPHSLGFGAEGNYLGFGKLKNTFVKDWYFSRPPSEASAERDASRLHGLYLDDSWKINNNFNLYLGLRYDNFDADQSVDQVAGYFNGYPTGYESTKALLHEDTLSPKVKLGYLLTRGVEISVKGARSVRFPTNPEIYWYYAGYRPEVDTRTTVTRKGLTYEDAQQYKIGVEISRFPWVWFNIAYYYKVDDYIRTIYGYAPSRVVYNIDDVKFQGIEFNIHTTLKGPFSVFANFTYQDTKKRGDVFDNSNSMTDKLSELPEYKANLGIKYERPDGIMGKITFRYVDSREVPVLWGGDAPGGTPIYSSGVTLEKLDSFITADILIKLPIWKKTCEWDLYLGITNLFDKEYEEEFEVPAPPRIYSAALQVTF